ncbi:MAG: APC family permease [Chloroflexi bacterium]|nr:MAG: APC family permease [Chloroflexota bacterium]
MKTGLAIMASDNISSSAYATEEAMRVLAFAGLAALTLTMPIAIAVCVVLAVVVLSESRVIRAYPNGGGSYIVASQNLGMFPGLVAAAALLTDYILTVAVSVAAGTAALASAIPSLDRFTVPISVTFIVIIAFTLSQTGMVRRWLRLRSRGWLVSAAINALGAFATGVVAIVVGIGKFELGAWMVVAIIPVLVAMLYGINRHYRVIGDKLLIATSVPVRLRAATPRVIVPISRIDRPSLNAVSIAKGLGGDIYAVHISFDADGAKAFKRRWAAVVGDAIPLDTIISPYRALLPPLLRYIDAVDRGDPERPIIVVLAEFVPRHWWEALLHNQTALLLKLRLFTRRNTSVMDVPYHLDDADAGDDRRR